MAMVNKYYAFRPGRNMKKEQKNPGILSIDNKYELTAHVLSSDKSCWTYNCKYRLSPMVRCPATAKVISFDGRWVLHSAEDNHKCEPSRARVTAEELKARMKDIVRKDPAKPVSHAARVVRLEAAREYGDDEEFHQNLVSELGSDAALEKQLLRVRYEVMGETPRSRNAVDPVKFFEGVFGEDGNVVVGDSNELDANWRDEIDKTNPESDYDWSKLNNDLLDMEQSHVEQLEEVVEK